MSDRDKHRVVRLAAELAEAQRKLEETHVVMRILPVEYVDALAAVWHVAHNGVKRDDGLGYVRFGGAESRPPRRDPEALRALVDEKRELVARARRLLGGLEKAS